MNATGKTIKNDLKNVDLLDEQQQDLNMHLISINNGHLDEEDVKVEHVEQNFIKPKQDAGDRPPLLIIAHEEGPFRHMMPHQLSASKLGKITQIETPILLQSEHARAKERQEAERRRKI